MRRIIPYLWLVRRPEFGRIYLRRRREFLQQERLSEAEMHRLQWERLTRLLQHAYENVPFHRRRFDEAGVHPSTIATPEDVRRIPVLKRSDLQNHLEELVATNCRRSKLWRDHTGGSSGIPVAFYADWEGRACERAAEERARLWMGYREGQKLAIVWGADRDIPDMSWLRRQYVHRVLRQRWLNAYNLTNDRMEEFARLMLRWRPRYILAYAAALYMFALFLRERGLDRIRPAAIWTSAEKLWDYQRELIEDVFKCGVFDCYGSREVAAVAFECEQHRGLHVSDDHVYLEVLCDGRPAKPGEMGEIIVTALDKFSMPFIRYQNGDLARPSDEKCPCGRPFPLLAEIVGRSNDVLLTPNGQYVHGAFFNHLFFGVDGVQQFQVHQKTLTEVDIVVKARRPVLPETLDDLRGRIVAHLGPEVQVRLRQVEAIPPAPSGKFRYIMSDVGAKFITE